MSEIAPKTIEFVLPFGIANAHLITALTGAVEELDSQIAFGRRGPFVDYTDGLEEAQAVIQAILGSISKANQVYNQEAMAAEAAGDLSYLQKDED
jgi:hypothetical protein